MFNIGSKPRLLLLLAASIGARGAELSVEIRTPEGFAPEMAIRFTAADAKVAALQFDVTCAPAFSTAPTAGAVTSSSGKTLYVRPLNTPRRGATVQYMRFLIVGLNGTLLEDGVVASLPIRPGLTAANVYKVEFANVVASDPAAVAVPITALGWARASRQE